VICDSQTATLYSLKKEDLHSKMIKENKTWWNIWNDQFNIKLVNYSVALSKRLDTKIEMQPKANKTAKTKQPKKKEEPK